jgi:protease-4
MPTTMRNPLKIRSVFFAVASSFVLCSTLRTTKADPPPARETPILPPGRSIAANDQSSAIATNPANLGYLTSTEARWTWVKTGDGSPVPSRGHSFDFALPLPGGIGTGLRLDFARPNANASVVNQNYAWLTWGFGVAPASAWSIGFSVQHAYSSDSALDGATSVTLSTTARPSPFFALSVVGRDLNEPSTRLGMTIDRSVDVALAVRPTGRRNLEIGLEDHYLSGAGQWLPRGVVAFDVPHVGRVRGDIALSDPTLSGRISYAATAGLEIGVDTSTVEGGAVFGTGVGGSDGAGFYMGAAITDYRSPGIPQGTYALKIRLEDTPNARNHVHLMRQLWQLARDPDLAAVMLQLKAEPADSLAHAEEFGDAIRLLRANGKKVVCQLEDAQGRGLYVCAQADRIVIHPAGVVRFAGLRMQYQYYASLLDKLGIHAQFVRIGAHKSAPEAFTRDDASDVARGDHMDLLHEYEDVFLSDVGGGRRIPRAELASIFSRGPFIAAEATQSHLVDGTAFDDELGKVVEEVVGRHVGLRDSPRPREAPARFGHRREVAVVYVEGDMVDGKSRDVPLIGTRLVGSYTVAKALKQAREDPHVGAVVLRVESPGGSSLAADVMWREAKLTAKVKPVVVSMGSYAASGGYYIASAGNEIFANELTITGSIGIFYGKADVSELFKKIGVGTETYKTTPRADGESIYRPYTDDELAALQIKVQQLYEIFLDRVAEGRKMSREEVDAVGQGRVWTGRQAAARHLVDHIGGIRQAIAEARRLGGLEDDSPIEELPVPEQSLLDLALKLAGASAQPSPMSALPRPILDVAEALAPFTIYDSDIGLARMEIAPVSAP